MEIASVLLGLAESQRKRLGENAEVWVLLDPDAAVALGDDRVRQLKAKALQVRRVPADRLGPIAGTVEIVVWVRHEHGKERHSSLLTSAQELIDTWPGERPTSCSRNNKGPLTSLS